MGSHSGGGHGHSHSSSGHGHSHGGSGHSHSPGIVHSSKDDKEVDIEKGNGHHGHNHDHSHVHGHSHGEKANHVLENEHHGHSHGEKPNHGLENEHHGHSHGNGSSPPHGLENEHHGHSHGNGSSGEDQKSLAMRAAMVHVIGDLVQSVGVILAGIMIWWKPFDLGTTADGISNWVYMDPICTLVFSVLVIMTTISTCKQAIRQVFMAVPDHVDSPGFYADVMKVTGVLSCHDFHVWKVGPTVFCTAHVEITDSQRSTQILEKLVHLAQEKYRIGHSTFQLEVTGEYDHSIEHLEIGDSSCHDYHCSSEGADSCSRVKR